MAPRKRSASVNRGTTKDRTPSPSPKRQIAAKHAATPSTPSPSPKSKSSQRSIKAAVPTTTAGGETHAPFEFGGPILGPVVLVFTLPLLVWWTAFHCSSTGWPSTGLAWPPSARLIPSWNDFRSSLDLSAFGVYCAWFALQVLLHLIIPGRVVSGTALADGTRLPYKINGWRCFLASHVVMGALHYSQIVPLSWIYFHFVQLATSAIIFSTVMAVLLYLVSFDKGTTLAAGGDTGFGIYDFFIGRELNPRITLKGRLPSGTLDLKYFCELRPGLFLWHFINLAMMYEEYSRRGSVSTAMILVVAFQALYVADAVAAEESILTTIDIVTDGFGFMLAFGDLAWLPFLYSMQARFLVDFPQTLSLPYAALCAATALGGFAVFRSANSQKDAFKRDPASAIKAGARVITTPTGSRLLCSGWWGASRHINYFGDWLLALGMSLPTGFVTPITYFYPIYFAVLLIHREMRDDHKCSTKYGPAWEQYKKVVPYRIIPFVY